MASVLLTMDKTSWTDTICTAKKTFWLANCCKLLSGMGAFANKNLGGGRRGCSALLPQKLNTLYKISLKQTKLHIRQSTLCFMF